MKILNRRARHDYQLFEQFEAGLVLTGAEAKSLKEGRGDISHAFVRLRNGEAWLVGANIPLYSGASVQGYDPLRTRKVLLHKAELTSLGTKIGQQKLTIVLISVYNKGRLVKARLALGKGKRQYEKREAQRMRDIQRDTERALSEKS